MTDRPQYRLNISRRGPPPRPFGWEICRSDDLSEVERSPETFRARYEAIKSGEQALKELNARDDAQCQSALRWRTSAFKSEPIGASDDSKACTAADAQVLVACLQVPQMQPVGPCADATHAQADLGRNRVHATAIAQLVPQCIEHRVALRCEATEDLYPFDLRCRSFDLV